MIALFAIRSLMSPTTSHLSKALVVVSVAIMMSAAFVLQRSRLGVQTFQTFSSMIFPGGVQVVLNIYVRLYMSNVVQAVEN
jgi:hypothetical protein